MINSLKSKLNKQCEPFDIFDTAERSKPNPLIRNSPIKTIAVMMKTF